MIGMICPTWHKGLVLQLSTKCRSTSRSFSVELVLGCGSLLQSCKINQINRNIWGGDVNLPAGWVRLWGSFTYRPTQGVFSPHICQRGCDLCDTSLALAALAPAALAPALVEALHAPRKRHGAHWAHPPAFPPTFGPHPRQAGRPVTRKTWN